MRATILFATLCLAFVPYVWSVEPNDDAFAWNETPTILAQIDLPIPRPPQPPRPHFLIPRIPQAPSLNITPPSPPQPPLPPSPPLPPTPPLPPAIPTVHVPYQYRQFRAYHELLAGRLPQEYLMNDMIASEADKQEEEPETLEDLIVKLLEGCGPNARFGVTKHFVFIYDTTNDYACWCALLFERVEAIYEEFVTRMGIGETWLTEPMVVFIFTNQEDYEAYLKSVNAADFAAMKNKPTGCFFHQINRTAIYDVSGVEKTKEDSKKRRTLEDVATELLARPRAMENLSVIVHEATHQVAFNRGLFGREGKSKNPEWAVEGLSMLFEPPCGEIKDGGWTPKDDFVVNMARVREFQAYVKEHPDEKPLRQIVSCEKISTDDPAGYPVSWALFYYLYRNAPAQLAKYLYGTAIQQPRESYPVAERVAEFEACFGDDWDGLYLKIRDFVDQLEKEPKAAAPAKPDAPQEPKKDEQVEKKENEAEEAKSEPAKTEEKTPDASKEESKSEQKSEPNAEPVKAYESKTYPAPRGNKRFASLIGSPLRLEGLLLDGKEFDWASYRGNVVLVECWATWNEASVKEYEELRALYDKYHAAGFEIVGYSLDAKLYDLRKYVAEHEAPWAVVSALASSRAVDSNGKEKYVDLTEFYGVYRVPIGILVDKDGKTIETNARGDRLRELLKKEFPNVE